MQPPPHFIQFNSMDVCVCVLICASDSGLPGFGSCQTQVWQRPNSGLAAAKLWSGSCKALVWAAASCQTLVWQLGFGSCQTQAWQLPNSGLLGSGSCQARVDAIVLYSFCQFSFFGFTITLLISNFGSPTNYTYELELTICSPTNQRINLTHKLIND